MLIKLLLPLGLGFLVVNGVNAFLTPSDELQRSDVIIAISGGDTSARASEAIKLYQEGWAPKLIFSGAAQDPSSPSNARVMRRLAREAGVPSQVITIDELAVNTTGNAEQSSDLVRRGQYDSLILVTSPYHQRRAYIEFRDKLGDEVKIINHSAPDASWSRRWWWVTPFGWYLTLSESVKTIVTWLLAR